MPWWQGGSRSHSSDDSILDGKQGFFASQRHRFLNRARKLRQCNGNEPELWRLTGIVQGSPVRSAVSSPQPLPEPELLRDPRFSDSGSSLPLPPPENVQNLRGDGDEREVAEAVEVVGMSNKLKGDLKQDVRTNQEHFEEGVCRKLPERQTAKGKVSSNITIPVSVPNAHLSSFGLSHPRNNTCPSYPPGFFQALSAPDKPPLVWNPCPSLCSQVPFEKSSNIDCSVQISPKNVAYVCSKSPPRPASPMSYKVSSDSPLARWDNVTPQVAVHPLPLPPGLVAPSRPPLMSAVGCKPETPGNSSPLPMCSTPVKIEWQKGKLIGRGTFGNVYVATNRVTGALCAMKEAEILQDDPKSAECIQQLQQEIKVLSHLKHPNIVQYYGSEIIDDKFYIYLEYLHPGSINKFVQDHFGAITEFVVQSFTRHILSGLAYLHSKKTIHRDIKGANLLVNAYGVVKLADFGMAKHLTSQTGYLSMKGSPYWMAPELLQSSAQTDYTSDVALAVDIWSLGCTIIEMMNGKPPWSEYEGAAAMFKVLQAAPPIPETMSFDGKDFLRCCFRRNPKDRPTANQLLDHPFVSHSHDQAHSTIIES